MLTAMVPLLAWVAGALLIFARMRRMVSLRACLLISTALCAAWLTLGIELLGYFHAIRLRPVFFWWLIPLLLVGGGLVYQAARGRWPIPRRPKLKIVDFPLLALIVFMLGWAWCQAVFSPPNNVDSNEYHLQRQVFWMQQGSVEHFPTSNPRQIAMPPLSEYAGLTLMVLTGGDHYHNLVQWLAFGMAMVAVSLVTRRYGGSSSAQLLAVLWVGTIPLAFMQASNTKNDVVVMMWVCILMYWVLALDRRHWLRWGHVVLMGIALGAAMLTKGTGMIFALPVAVLAAVYLFWRHWRLAVPALTVIAAVALALNAGHFVRNYRVFGAVAPDNPGIHGINRIGNEDFSAGAVISNMIRAAGSHFVVPSADFNNKVTDAVKWLHEKMSRNIDDPRTTWLPGGRFRPYQFYQDDEDKAAAPAHLLMVLLLPIALMIERRRVPWRAIVPILFAFIAGFVLFSLLLKWQNWHVRLIITLPAILAPVFGWTFAARRLRWVAALPVLLLFVTLMPSLNSLPRPLLGEKSIFRADPLTTRSYWAPQRAQEYRQMAVQLREYQPKIVGFSTPVSAPDYPMQRLLLDTFPPLTFTVFNATQAVPGQTEPDPDVVLLAGSNPARLQHAATGTWYVRVSRLGRYALLVKE